MFAVVDGDGPGQVSAGEGGYHRGQDEGEGEVLLRHLVGQRVTSATQAKPAEAQRRTAQWRDAAASFSCFLHLLAALARVSSLAHVALTSGAAAMLPTSSGAGNWRRVAVRDPPWSVAPSLLRPAGLQGPGNVLAPAGSHRGVSL